MKNREVSWLLIWLSGALGGIAMRATSTADVLAAASVGVVALWLSGVVPTWKEIRQSLRGSSEGTIVPEDDGLAATSKE